jgi:hypothetical protein
VRRPDDDGARAQPVPDPRLAVSHPHCRVRYLPAARLCFTFVATLKRYGAPRRARRLDSPSRRAFSSSRPPVRGGTPVRLHRPQRVTGRALALVLASGLVAAAPASATVVTNTADSGAGSLRQAVIDTPPGGAVTFDASVTGTITFTTGAVPIAKNLTIDGPGARVLSLSGNNASRIFEISGSAVVTINRLTLTNGQSPNAASEAGGAILANGASLTLQDSAILNSRAGPAPGGATGGAINHSGGSLTIRRSLVAGNKAEGGPGGTALGGGIEAATGGLTLENSTVTGNSATSTQTAEGGGIDNYGNLTILNSTIAFNSVDGGTLERAGGVFSNWDAPPTRSFQANIIASNAVVGGAGAASHDCDSNGAAPAIPGSDNVIGTPSGCSITGTNNSLTTPAPGLTPLANNGGPTDTVALTPTSPALDHVAPAACPPPATDQRGFPRPMGTACESGAWEAQIGLTIDPPSHDFGSILIRGTSSRATSAPFRFTVKNVGDFTANLTTVATGIPQFAVQPGADPGRCPFALAAGATCFIDVTFTPSAPGAVSSFVRADSSNSGFAQAALAGVGVDPCASDKQAPKVTIASDQKRAVYGTGQLASITTKASDPSGLNVNPSRSKQKLATTKAGSFSVVKRATDKCDNRGSTTFRYRVVSPPRASIVHDSAPSGCQPKLLVEARVSSVLPLRRAQLLVDGRVKLTSTRKRLQLPISTRSLGNGPHSVTIKVVDTLGRRATATRKFVISCSRG